MFWIFKKQNHLKETSKHSEPTSGSRDAPNQANSSALYALWLDTLDRVVNYFMTSRNEIGDSDYKKLKVVVEGLLARIASGASDDALNPILQPVLRRLYVHFLNLFSATFIKNFSQNDIDNFETRMVDFLKQTEQSTTGRLETDSKNNISGLIRCFVDCFDRLLLSTRRKEVFELLSKGGLVDLLFSQVAHEKNYQLDQNSILKETRTNLPSFTLHSFPSNQTLSNKPSRTEPSAPKESAGVECSFVNVYLQSAKDGHRQSITKKILANRKQQSKKLNIDDNILFESMSNPNFSSINTNLSRPLLENSDQRRHLNQLLNRQLGSPLFESKPAKNSSFKDKREIRRQNFFRKKVAFNGGQMRQSKPKRNGRRDFEKLFEMRKQSLQKLLKTPKDSHWSSISLFHSFKQDNKLLRQRKLGFKGFMERKYSHKVSQSQSNQKRLPAKVLGKAGASARPKPKRSKKARPKAQWPKRPKSGLKKKLKKTSFFRREVKTNWTEKSNLSRKPPARISTKLDFYKKKASSLSVKSVKNYSKGSLSRSKKNYSSQTNKSRFKKQSLRKAPKKKLQPRKSKKKSSKAKSQLNETQKPAPAVRAEASFFYKKKSRAKINALKANIPTLDFKKVSYFDLRKLKRKRATVKPTVEADTENSQAKLNSARKIRQMLDLNLEQTTFGKSTL